MKCAEKRAYGSRLEAESALHRTRQNVRMYRRNGTNPGQKSPTRVYRCPHCDKWHLTSRPDADALNASYAAGARRRARSA